MIVSAVDLLQRNPDPSDDEIRAGLEGNLCRCTGYENIVKAVRAAGKAMRDGTRAAQRAELMPMHPPAEEPPPSGEGIIPPQLQEAHANGVHDDGRRAHPAPRRSATHHRPRDVRRRRAARSAPCYAAFVRSPYGHAKIAARSTRRARRPIRACSAVYTGDDLHHAHNLKSSLPVAHKMPDLKTPPHYILAHRRGALRRRSGRGRHRRLAVRRARRRRAGRSRVRAAAGRRRRRKAADGRAVRARVARHERRVHDAVRGRRSRRGIRRRRRHRQAAHRQPARRAGADRAALDGRELGRRHAAAHAVLRDADPASAAHAARGRARAAREQDPRHRARSRRRLRRQAQRLRRRRRRSAGSRCSSNAR